MDIKNKKEVGNLNISHSVIEKIASIAIIDIDGVHSMAIAPKNVKGIFLGSQKSKSIKISLNMDVAQIDVYINVKMGYKIRDIAEKIQLEVKESVQNMACIPVSKVNVYVQGVKTDEE